MFSEKSLDLLLILLIFTELPEISTSNDIPVLSLTHPPPENCPHLGLPVKPALHSQMATPFCTTQWALFPQHKFEDLHRTRVVCSVVTELISKEIVVEIDWEATTLKEADM